jgi:hypothetical protein
MKNLIVVGISLFCIGCNKGDEFQNAMHNKLKAGSGARLKIQECTSFGWETLYVYGPYCQFDSIKQQTGFDPSTLVESVFRIDFLQDTECILVFMKQGQYVSDIRIKRNEVDFANVIGVYSKDKAVFIFEPSGYENWPYLKRSS